MGEIKDGTSFESPIVADDPHERTKYIALKRKLHDMQCRLAKRENEWNSSLETAENQIQLLQGQLSSVLDENKQLQFALDPLSTQATKALHNIINSEIVCPLRMDNADLGLVLKLNSLWEPLTAIRESILNLLHDEDEPTFVLAKGQGRCDNSCFPKQPRTISESCGSAIEKINTELGMPGLNVAGLLRVTPEGANVSNLLQKTPMNAIWLNVGDSPLLVKIRSNEQSNSMLLSPGYAFVLGRHEANWKVDISCFSLCMDSLFKSGKDKKQPYAICLTTGTFVRNSWLNALNTEKSAEHPNVQADCDMSVDLNFDRPHLRDRLLASGAQLRNRSMIRLAPLKSAGLPADFLDSKA